MSTDYLVDDAGGLWTPSVLSQFPSDRQSLAVPTFEVNPAEEPIITLSAGFLGPTVYPSPPTPQAASAPPAATTHPVPPPTTQPS